MDRNQNEADSLSFKTMGFCDLSINIQTKLKQVSYLTKTNIVNCLIIYIMLNSATEQTTRCFKFFFSHASIKAFARLFRFVTPKRKLKKVSSIITDEGIIEISREYY